MLNDLTPTTAEKTPPTVLKSAYKRSSAEVLLHAALAQYAPELAASVSEQHRFAWASMKRQWRWDACFLNSKVAVEIHGGTWTNGRHNRGGGVASDAEKLCAGTELGWAVLVYTSSQIKTDPAGVVGQIARVIAARTPVASAAEDDTDVKDTKTETATQKS